MRAVAVFAAAAARAAAALPRADKRPCSSPRRGRWATRGAACTAHAHTIGRGWPAASLPSPFVRLPSKAQAALCDSQPCASNCTAVEESGASCESRRCAVWGLSQSPTGLYVRFSTPASSVAVRWRSEPENGDWLWAFNGHSGMDLWAFNGHSGMDLWAFNGHSGMDLWAFNGHSGMDLYAADASTGGVWRWATSSGNNQGGSGGAGGGGRPMAVVAEEQPGGEKNFSFALGP
eukprot:gene26576-32840_t